MICHYQLLGKFGLNIDDAWRTPDEHGDYPDDNEKHPDEETMDDIETNQHKEEN
jgi:hypothetical protein